MVERGGHFEIGTVTRHNTSPGSKALDLRLNFTVDLLGNRWKCKVEAEAAL